MGLLTGNTDRFRPGFVKLAEKSTKLAILVYLVGLIWIICLPLDTRKTYMSENALMPGQATSQSRLNRGRVIKVSDEATLEWANNNGKLPVAWAKKKMEAIGLETYEQSFQWTDTIDNDYLQSNGNSSASKKENINDFQGNNVYGVLRSGRSDGAEGLIIVINYEKEMDKKETHLSLSLAFDLFRFLKDQIYWSRDVVFLISEGGNLGVEAWLLAYHGIKEIPREMKFSSLAGYAGELQGGMVLKVNGLRFSGVDISFAGVNGQLPNLDLINMIVRIARNYNTEVYINSKPKLPSLKRKLKKMLKENYSKEMDLPMSTLDTTLNMMWKQASNLPDGVHGLFYKYNIHVASLSTRPDDKGVDIYYYGRIIENVLRSLNNLMEKFHQSFFYYLLPSNLTYISIGMYLIPVVLLISSLAIKAIGLWVESSDWYTVGRNGNDLKKESEFTFPDTPFGFSRRDRDIATPLKYICFSILNAMVVSWLPLYILPIVGRENLKIVYALVFGSSTLLFGICSMYFGRRSIGNSNADSQSQSNTSLDEKKRDLKDKGEEEKDVADAIVNRTTTPVQSSIENLQSVLFPQTPEYIQSDDWILIKCFLLALVCCLLINLVLVNFSFGAYLSIIVTPFLILVRPSKLFSLGGLLSYPMYSCLFPPILVFILYSTFPILNNPDCDLLEIYYHAFRLLGVFTLPIASLLLTLCSSLCFVILRS